MHAVSADEWVRRQDELREEALVRPDRTPALPWECPAGHLVEDPRGLWSDQWNHLRCRLCLAERKRCPAPAVRCGPLEVASDGRHEMARLDEPPC